MRAIRVVLPVIAIASLAGGGWWYFGRSGGGDVLRATPGQIAVRFGGKYQGTMSLPATLNWCPVTRIGVLEGLSGDSGVAVIMYERDSLVPGPHLVASPELAVGAAKPAASIVMRWIHLRPDTALAGYRSESGTVRIQFASGRASGDVNARMRSATSADTISVRGVFNGVPVVATAKGCT